MGQGRLHKKEVFNLKHKGIIYSPPQASWAVNEMWPSPCSLGSIRLRFTKLLFISRFTKDQAYLHHGTQNSLLCDTGLGHTLHSGVTKSQFSLLKVPSLLHLFLTAGGKGQPFPPVLHLMENLTKCSERKKKKKKEKRHNCFSCSFCLYQESIWCQQRLWMPWGSTQPFWTILPSLLADPGPGEQSSPKAVTSQTRDCWKAPGAPWWTTHPTLKWVWNPAQCNYCSGFAFLFLQCSASTAQPQSRRGTAA